MPKYKFNNFIATIWTISCRQQWSLCPHNRLLNH